MNDQKQVKDQQLDNTPSPLVYFDSRVVRALIDNPHNWYQLDDDLASKFGADIRPIWSYPVFFEFLGIKKERLNIQQSKILISNPVFNTKVNNNRKLAEKELPEIGKILEKNHEEISASIKTILADPIIKNIFKEAIQKRIDFNKSMFQPSSELLNILSKNIVDDFYTDYEKFSRGATLYLAWDVFCNIPWANISNELLREAQLDIWRQLLQIDSQLPFGKIIDDLAKQNNIILSKNSFFDGREDMVDTEAMTYATMGLVHKNGEIEPVIVITCDPVINIQERAKLGETIFMRYLKKTNRKPGQYYRYNLIDRILQLDQIIPQN